MNANTIEAKQCITVTLTQNEYSQLTPTNGVLYMIDNGSGIERIYSGSELIIESTSEPIVETTYSALKQLKDNSQLKSGQVYRITDYHAFVNPFLDYFGSDAFSYSSNAISSLDTGQQTDNIFQDIKNFAPYTVYPIEEARFDILVTAETPYSLYEDALALPNEDNEEYYQYCDLTKWKLKYDIETDTDRYYNINFGFVNEVAHLVKVINPYRQEYDESTGDYTSIDMPLVDVFYTPYGMMWQYGDPFEYTWTYYDNQNQEVTITKIVIAVTPLYIGMYYENQYLASPLCYLMYESVVGGGYDTVMEAYVGDTIRRPQFSLSIDDNPSERVEEYEYRGYVTYMKDEYGNEAHYDFKGVYHMCNGDLIQAQYNSYEIDGMLYPTFTTGHDGASGLYHPYSDITVADASIYMPRNNRIGKYEIIPDIHDESHGDLEYIPCVIMGVYSTTINNVVIDGAKTTGNLTDEADFPKGMKGFIIVAGECSYVDIGKNASSIMLGDGTGDVKIGDNCDCLYLRCYDLAIGDNCRTIRALFTWDKLNSTIGNNCADLYFGGMGGSFADYTSKMHIGNNVRHCMFTQNNQDVVIQDNCSFIQFYNPQVSGDYNKHFKNVVVGSNNHDIYLKSTGSTSFASPCQDIYFEPGTCLEQDNHQSVVENPNAGYTGNLTIYKRDPSLVTEYTLPESSNQGWIKVTQNLSDWSGEYLLVSLDDSYMATGNLANYVIACSSVLVQDGSKISVTDASNAKRFTVSDKYFIQSGTYSGRYAYSISYLNSNNERKYLTYSASGLSNSSSVGANTRFIIEIDTTTGKLNIISNGSTTTRLYFYQPQNQIKQLTASNHESISSDYHKLAFFKYVDE